MKKAIFLSIILVIAILSFIGCTTKSLSTSVEGQWNLETISDTSGEILVIGKAYKEYDDFNGKKEEILAILNEDGTFEITGSEENLQGKYNKDKELSTTDAVAITMNFDNGAQIMAAYGIRQYQDGKEIESLIFTLDEKVYSFIKSAANY